MATALDLTGDDDDELLARIRSRSDAEALAEDWRIVGDDLRTVMADFGASTVPLARPPEEPPKSER